LGRRGYVTFGVDISADLIEIADGEAEMEGIGYFDSEKENRRTFEVIADALRPRGRHLAQLPNVRFAEQRLPERDWRLGDEIVELIEQRWNPEARRLEGESFVLRDEGRRFMAPAVAFRPRLYTVAELRNLYTSVGMSLVAAFDAEGNPDPRAVADPSPEHPDIFVLAEKA
jgi:hypothetical protein